jgi:hypothetical protein
MPPNLSITSLGATTLMLAVTLALSACDRTPNTRSAPERPVSALGGEAPASSCAAALREGTLCHAANAFADSMLKAGELVGLAVMQNVQTGEMVVLAASHPDELDVASTVLPLSLSKLWLAAAWWESAGPDTTTFTSSRGRAGAANPAFRSRVNMHEMVVGGSDSAGREAAERLRALAGSSGALALMERFGLSTGECGGRDSAFWGEIPRAWESRLVPPRATLSLTPDSDAPVWNDVFSIGETHFGVTALHVSRFLQAVGNDGHLLPPIARPAADDAPASPPRRLPGSAGGRIMTVETARRLQSALRDVVSRGTATSVAGSLAEHGWTMGGKTGSGPGTTPLGPNSDGWFAGLVFDPQAKPRFTVACFIRRAGPGGGNAARLCAGVARFVVGGVSGERPGTRERPRQEPGPGAGGRPRPLG